MPKRLPSRRWVFIQSLGANAFEDEDDEYEDD
jgi:hypothetical protein